MNVLYVTANSHLRSTTSSLNAIIGGLEARGVRPIMLFTEPGPWQQALATRVNCLVRKLPWPDRARPFSSAYQTGSLARLIRRHRIDLVHCNEHELYPAMRVAARLAGVPVVVTLHWNLEAGFGHWAFARPYAPAAIQFLSRAQLEASSPGLPRDLPADRVKLLMSGLFIDEFLGRGDDGRGLRASWTTDPAAVVLGIASAIKPRKHLEDFIELVSRLRASGRPVYGVVAGGGRFEDPAYRAQLDRLVCQRGLKQHVRFVGNLDPVTPFFKAIDIAVNTSEMEILSMSMCESMACAKPTVGYDVGGNAETVHEPGFVVPFGDIDRLCRLVGQLADDSTFRLQSGQAAARHVRAHFDVPVLAARQAAIYVDALGARAAAVWPEGRTRPVH